MPSTNNVSGGIMIIPDPDDFIRIMAKIEDDYKRYHGQAEGDGDE